MTPEDRNLVLPEGFFEPVKKKTIGMGNSRLGLIALIMGAMAMGGLDEILLPNPIREPRPERERKKCLLDGCEKMAEQGQTHCSAEHFREWKKQKRDGMKK